MRHLNIIFLLLLAAGCAKNTAHPMHESPIPQTPKVELKAKDGYSELLAVTIIPQGKKHGVQYQTIAWIKASSDYAVEVTRIHDLDRNTVTYKRREMTGKNGQDFTLSKITFDNHEDEFQQLVNKSKDGPRYFSRLAVERNAIIKIPTVTIYDYVARNYYHETSRCRGSLAATTLLSKFSPSKRGGIQVWVPHLFPLDRLSLNLTTLIEVDLQNKVQNQISDWIRSEHFRKHYRGFDMPEVSEPYQYVYVPSSQLSKPSESNLLIDFSTYALECDFIYRSPNPDPANSVYLPLYDAETDEEASKYANSEMNGLLSEAERGIENVNAFDPDSLKYFSQTWPAPDFYDPYFFQTVTKIQQKIRKIVGEL